MHLSVSLPVPETVLQKWQFLLNAAAAACRATGALLVRNTADGVVSVVTSEGIADRVGPEAAGPDIETLLEDANLPPVQSLPVSPGDALFGRLVVVNDSPDPEGEPGRAVLQNLRDAIELDLGSLVAANPQPARGGAAQETTVSHSKEGGTHRAQQILDLCAEAAGIVVWEYDLTQDTVNFNPVNPEAPSPATNLVLPAETDMTLERFLEETHPDDHRTMGNVVAAVRQGKQESFHFEHRLRRTDGAWRWLLSVGRGIPEDGKWGSHAYGISVDITPLKEAENELREQAAALKKREAILRFTTRLGRCGAWEYDRGTDILRSSPEASTLFGFPPGMEHPLGFYISLIPEEDRELVGRAMERTLREGTDFEIEHPVVRPGGSISYVRQRGEAVRDEEGAITGVWGVIQDITEEAREETRRDLLWGLAKVAFWEYDVKEQVYRSEPRMADLLELPPNRLILTRKQIAELIHPDDLGAYLGAIVEGTKRRLADLVVGCRLLVGGKMKHIRTILHQEFNADGELVERYGINMDVTEEKEAELAIREQEERLRLTTEAAELGTWEWNPTTGDASASDRWFDMVGFEGKEKPTRIDFWYDNLHPDDKPGLDALLEQQFRGGSDAVDVEFRFWNPKKGWIWLHGSGKVVERGAAGEPIRMLGVHHDITEKKESQRRLAEQAEQLRHAQKMEAVGELAGGVAHEFNNLLQVISGYGELLEDCLANQPEASEHLKAVMGASGRGAELVRQLMQFSHKEAVSRNVVDLSGLVSGMHSMLRRVLGENIDLRLHGPERLPPIFADQSQLRQVIMNLCLNARDAIGPDEGRITIELKREEFEADTEPAVPPGEYLVLSVADTGVGMSEEVRERIFDPFFTTKEVGKGTGLGLSAVLGIVEYYSGTITVESEPGTGTVVRVLLPTAQEIVIDETPAKVEGIGEPESLSENSTRTAVLVAEDNPFVLELAVHSLAKLGFDAVAARDGAEALDLFRRYQDRVGFLLLDIIMPRQNGPHVYRAIRDLGYDLPVIFATGYGDTFVELDPVPPHYAFLAKPFNRRSLESAISEVWGRKMLRD